MGTRKPRLYKFRAVHIGPVWWNCPYCGHLNTNYLSWSSFIGDCKNKHCKVKLALGVHAMPVRQGARTDLLPKDMRVIDDRGQPFDVSPFLRDPHPEAELADADNEWLGYADVHLMSD